MDEKAQLLVALMGAGGGGAALLAFVNGMIKWLSGAAHREQTKNTRLEKQRLNAIIERDKADKRRREAEEHVSMLKNQLREHGLVPVERPDDEE